MSPNTQILIARKRSLGQGNIFTDVGHSVRGGDFPACITGGSASMGGWADPPPQYYWDTTDNKRAVRILLEYILVF